MRKSLKHLSILLLGIFLVASCHSTKQTETGQTSTNESAYKQRVLSNTQSASAVTAKMKAHVTSWWHTTYEA